MKEKERERDPLKVGKRWSREFIKIHTWKKLWTIENWVLLFCVWNWSFFCAWLKASFSSTFFSSNYYVHSLSSLLLHRRMFAQNIFNLQDKFTLLVWLIFFGSIICMKSKNFSRKKKMFEKRCKNSSTVHQTRILIFSMNNYLLIACMKRIKEMRTVN